MPVWKEQHKRICKHLNPGDGAMQVRTDGHTILYLRTKEFFEEGERSLDENGKRFFDLFEYSSPEESRWTAARKMKKIAKRQTKHNLSLLLWHSLHYLIRSHSQFLSCSNSPLLVLLHFVDPSVLHGGRLIPLDDVSNLANAFKYLTHVNQLILANQLMEHGANVNVLSNPQGETPLHKACYSTVVTNLDFIQLLLKEGADPNAQDHSGTTPLMCTIPDAPGAAEFLLHSYTTDANSTTQSGASFLAGVRKAVETLSDVVALPENPDKFQDQFLLRQWRNIEEMLVKRGATDTGITTLD
jgi:hypothetical protein